MSQMHSAANVAPGPAVVYPFPQLVHCVGDMASLYELFGQVWQLAVVSPSGNTQPLPTPHEVAQ